MRRRLAIGLGVALLGLIAYGAVSWVFSEKLVAPHSTPLGPVDFSAFSLPEPQQATIRGEGVDLAAWYFDNPRGAGCAVVMLHGFGGSRAEVLAPSPIFWRRGCDLLLYDARGHGESDRDLLSFGVHERKDLLRTVEWLAAKADLSRAKIGLIGWSYGAATAIQAASEAGGDVAFVIADSSYSSMSDIARVQARKQFGRWAELFVPGALFVSAVRTDFGGERPAPATVIEDVRSPTLLIHSRQDEFTPVEQSELIYERSDKTHTRLVIPEWPAAHAHSYTENPVGYTAIVDGFLTEFAPDFGARLER